MTDCQVERKDTRACLGAPILLTAALLAPLPACAGTPAAQEEKGFRGGEQTIVVHGDRVLGGTRLREGPLHGITYTRGKDYSRAIALIADLKPRSWRLANHHNNVYGFVVGEAGLPKRIGTEIVFTLQDAFSVRYGYNVRIDGSCRPGAKSCFSSYESFKKAWTGVAHAVMKHQSERRFVADYIEIFGEPTNGHTKLGLSPQQFGDTFKTTHDIVRQYRPDAKIVAPSIVSYQERFFKAFLSFVAEHNLRVDAVSWHEFEAPERLLAHAKAIREIFHSQPRLCQPACPEIHINEYASDRQHLIPGYNVGWLYYLERAKVDHANRACWDVPQSGSTCWAGFNGLLMPDNATPTVNYWVYRTYSDLFGVRVASESAMPRTVAVATRDDARREYRILAGRYGQKGAAGRVTLELRDYRYDPASARVELFRMPNTGNALRAAPSRPQAHAATVRVQGGTAFIVIDDFQDGDAYGIVVRPGGGGAAR